MSCMVVKCAVNFCFETGTANCSIVPVTSITHLDELTMGLKVFSFPQGGFSMATLTCMPEFNIANAYHQ